MRLLTDALSSAGNAMAQAALVKVIRIRHEDAAALAVLVPALAMVESPTLEAEETLRELAKNHAVADIRASAELGLGTMAHQLAPTAPQRASRIAGDMAGLLAAATSPEMRRHYLLVLGNGGLSESLAAIKPHLTDPAPTVRAAATAALRWLATPRADELLCEALARDADPTVRVEAATALSFRTMTPATFAVQKSAFFRDESISVRLAVLRNLARAQDVFPDAQSILTQAAGDSCQQVREEAATLLATK
jgi:HEAT repeat protein